MKKILLSLILVVFLSSCSDTEPITFLETHHLSVWERTDGSDPEQKIFIRILSNRNKIAETWSPTITDDGCYSKVLFEHKVFDVESITDTENILGFSGTDQFNGFPASVSIQIDNDSMIVSKSNWNPHGGYQTTSIWVKSKVNVDDLNLCD